MSTDRQPVLPYVLSDLTERVRGGTAQYGEPLTTHNSRDALQDAYEELLDGALYLRQAILERDARKQIEAKRLKPESTLKACPFDGGTRLVVTQTPRFGGEPEPDEIDFYAYNVHCLTCAADGPWKKSQSGAEQFWNGVPGTERGGSLIDA